MRGSNLRILRTAAALALTVFFAGNAMLSQQSTRTEKDLLGEKQVPANAYYGIQTARALENFQLSGIPINHYPEFIDAWAIVKLAAAQANTDVGAMKPERLAQSRRPRRLCEPDNIGINSWWIGIRAALELPLT